VARFVEGHFFPFLIVHAFAALGRSGDAAINRFIDFGHANRVFVETNGQDGGFVQDVFNIGARETNRPFREGVEVNGRINLLIARVDFEDGFTARGIRQTETVMMRSNRPGRKKGGIKDVVAVGRGDDQDAGVVFETIHLDEELVQGLLAFIVAAAKPAPLCRPTASISSMKTMHGAVCLAFRKRSRTRPAPTPTNISTKVRTGNAVERNARFACDRLG
jgi:hypothetical protein